MKTLQKVRERFYWNNVQSNVEKCCRSCDSCAALKGPRKRTRGSLQLYNVGAPFKRIAFDILGPFPRSSDGNNILVVMDYFTKWPEAYPISDQEASTVAEESVHELTGYSPSQMLFGRDLHLPADLLLNQPLDAPLAPEEYIEKLQARMEKMHHLARERIGITSEEMHDQPDTT
ncbi:retrovirus-related Pol polyprotein from transposon 412 [Trichonephila clavipes]|nr:retrovirus-related Pol polyprotein from transposon 412 [Trichonephila clavipes]